MIFQMLYVFNATRRQVVDDSDFITHVEMTLGQMRTDKTRSAGYQHFHIFTFPVDICISLSNTSMH
jgi:hypothetical protein